MADFPSLHCFYSILGVQKDSSSAEIRTAYLRLAMRWHPDRCSHEKKEVQEQAKLKFQKVQRAYQVLSDDEQRLLYDMGLYGDNKSGTKQNSSYESLAREFEELQKLFMTITDTRSSCKRGSQTINKSKSEDSDCNDPRSKKSRSPNPSSSSCSSSATGEFHYSSSTSVSWQHATDVGEMSSTCGSPKPHPKLCRKMLCDDPKLGSLLYDAFDPNIFKFEDITSSASYQVKSQAEDVRKVL